MILLQLYFAIAYQTYLLGIWILQSLAGQWATGFATSLSQLQVSLLRLM